jgi:hypothetical protein
MTLVVGDGDGRNHEKALSLPWFTNCPREKCGAVLRCDIEWLPPQCPTFRYQ